MFQQPRSLINYDALADAIGGAMARNIAARMGQKDADGMLTGFRHDASGSPASDGFMHGPNGLLRIPGVDPAVMQTIVGHSGILSNLQWTASVFTNPLYETITGITAGDTTEREEICDDAPTAGVKKGAIVQAPFGWVQRGTQEIDVTRLGQRLDRSDPMDLFVLGNPMGAAALPGGQDGLSLGNDQLINEWANLLGNRAVAMTRKLQSLVYTGDPANNTNGYQEFPGIQTLVATGYADAITGTAAPAMDSLIFDFGHTRIDSAMADLVETLTYLARYVSNLATRTGVAPVRWAFVMREEAFYEVTKAFACAYFLNGSCPTVDQATQRLVLDARDNVNLRDSMRTERYLLIDGQRWPVIFDDAIPEEDSSTQGNLADGCFASDIYLLPFSILNGRSVLYGEYFQFANPSTAQIFGQTFLGRVAGAFLEVPRQTNNCYVLDIHCKPRIVLRTPWLAGRINNVAYCPLVHTRQPFPDDGYFTNGGVVGERTSPVSSYTNVWD